MIRTPTSGAPASTPPPFSPWPRQQPQAQGEAEARAPAGGAAHGVAGGVVWIAVVAMLLAGVVALNVAVLRLNVELNKVNAERAPEGRQAGDRLAALARRRDDADPDAREP